MLTDPYNQKLFQCMLKTLEHSSQSFLYVDKNKRIPFYANKQAIHHFANHNGEINLTEIFHNEETPTFLHQTIAEQLSMTDYVMLHDIQVTSNKGEQQFCEIQVGYSDDERETIFIEIFFV